MNTLLLLLQSGILRRQGESSGGGLGCFVAILVVGIVVFLILKGRKDREEQLGAAHRPLGTKPLEAYTFPCPYPKCPSCGASGERMKQQYDGLRKVTWTCGYCGAVAGVQDLKDEELPPGVRQRLGLDMPQGMAQGQPYYPPQGGGGGGMGGLLTGMMIGSMMGGGHHHDGNRDGWGGGGSSDDGGDWGNSGGGDGGGSDWGDSGGSDWGDSGGGDSGGSDW